MNHRKEHVKPTKKGYIRTRRDGRTLMEHVRVWESYFGKVPEGMQIHHIDGNKQNNDINNLQLVTPLEHKRIHEGCKLINGIWYKPCICCGEYKPVDKEHWYYKQGNISGRLCKPCFIQKSLALRKELIAKGWKRKVYKPKNKKKEETNQKTLFDD